MTLSVACRADESPPLPDTPVLILEADPATRVSAAELKPGLAVSYYTEIFVRHIDKLIGHTYGDPGRPGPPITQLNHQFERNKVFDSGSNRGVGMRMEGYLNFAEQGTYHLRALANDGIRFLMGEQQLFEDPVVHGDRLSPVGGLNVDQPGWYPVTIWYYQRKGTAALKLYWQPPGASAETIVPAAVMAHDQQSSED